MQITNLKEILKAVYPFGYEENRYGLADPLTYHNAIPSMSGVMRLYIDDQEITMGLYGSGLLLMGNSNIDWVDHVEIYTQNPTYEYTTESTVTLVKLYSKSVKKDSGSKLKAALGSYGNYFVDGYSADWIGDWSYFLFWYGGDEKRKRYKSYQSELSRDRRNSTLVATLHKKDTKILLKLFHQEGDSFASLSADATPLESKLAATYMHIGINSKLEDLAYLLTLSYTDIQTSMFDDVSPIDAAPFFGTYPISSMESYTKDLVATGELKYKKQFRSDTLLAGGRYRGKWARWDRSRINEKIMVPSGTISHQQIATLFVEESHLFNPSSILSIGLEYQRVENSHSPQDDDLWMYRLSYTHTSDNLTLKSFYSHTLLPLEPYLVGSYTFLEEPTKHYPLQTMDALVEDIIYEHSKDRFELILDLIKSKNNYIPSANSGKITSYDKTLALYGAELRWRRYYRKHDKLQAHLSYRQILNAPFFIDGLREYRALVQNINSFKRWDIFNELLYTWNSKVQESYFNYSCAFTYHYSKDFSIALKGMNLFDNAREGLYVRIDPTTLQRLTPLRASSIDQEITLTASWIF